MAISDVTTIILLISGFVLFAVIIALLIIKFIKYFEENPYGSKNAFKKMTRSITLIYIAFLILKIPLKITIVNLLGHLFYMRIFNKYPNIDIKDTQFFVGLLITMHSHYEFTKFIKKANSNTIRTVIGYCMVWIDPILLCIAVSAAKNNVFFNN